MAGQGVVLSLGAGVLLFYVNRLFGELPLYAGDEGAYLIRALYARQLAFDPGRYQMVQPVANTLYFAIIRLVDDLSLNVIPWMRLIGAASYFGGLALLYSIAVKECGRKVALGFLLIAAVFPYYRFAFSAMPDGVYAGLLCLIAFVVYRTFLSRPLLGAVLVGGLSGALVLVKPHGVVVVAAYAALCLVDTLVRRAGLLPLLGRLALFGLAFLTIGVGVELADGQPLSQAISFFRGSAYAEHLGHATAVNAWGVAALSATSMTALTAIFVAVPLIAAATVMLRERGPGQLDSADLAFLFVALCLAATLAMVTIFSFKMAVLETETRRLWGRYFEFYVPMLWLLAARPLSAWERSSTLRRRGLVAGAILVGLAGLLGALALGVRLNPWDGTAITAFASPDVVRFPFGYVGGSRLVAILATLAIALATLAGVSVRRAWPAYFVVLGLLSTRADDAWVGEFAQRSRTIEHELHVAGALILDVAGPTVVIVNDGNDGHIAFLRLKGRVTVRATPPGPLAERPLRNARSAIVFGDRTPGAGWRKVFSGRELAAYVREPTT
ncbi:MAG: hypothetical protein V4514_05215 [Pseudomonadota bacterium]|uniref:hypothetical protein n=1 Tax=Phenylobacterium sp. Root700 TaxID=1736591 RepID=UPI0006FD77F9|nr:hypothetical protein [Phenylobacterium sp. Root700]KRB40060.1 hypothetical protein ASE02_09775 [Phenylobacterium sp. Root700]MBT9469716.1 hypothetical protein [Phenylobacterium sp.]